MRKLTFLAIIIFATSSLIRAQKLDLGMSFIPTASTVNFDMENFNVSTMLLAHTNFSTDKSFHCIAYNFNGSVTTIHGWLYTDNADLYLIAAKNISDKEGYLAIGWEHILLNGSFSPTGFIELGTNFAFSESYLSIGIFAPLNWKVWEKKK